MTAPVKERGTRRSFSKNSPWGKNLVRGGGGGFQRPCPNFLTPGEGSARKPRATLSRRARAPKPTASTQRSSALICCDFRAFLAPSCGYGNCDRGSRGCYGRRTLTSRPCGRRCGRHPSRGLAARAGRTRGRTARAGAAPAAGQASTRRSGTSSARTELPHCAGRRAADGRRSIHRSPARSSRDAGRVGAALRPSGYHLRAKQKSLHRHKPHTADHVAQALRHRHSSIFTMDSIRQHLQ